MPTRNQSRDHEILEHAQEITLDDLAHSCSVETRWVMELIEEGVIEPAAGSDPQWRFAATSIVRVQKARRIERDLGVNLAGIALALQLLDRIDALEARLRGLGQPPPHHDTDT
jgi:chaperone modulatory protein CbpM